MKTLLRIDASARGEGSHSRRLADQFQARWTAAHPDGRVVRRDLARTTVPHIDEATLTALYAPPITAPPGLALCDELVHELRSADHLLLASAMYNLTLPSTLKAYLDHVVRDGLTFTSQGGRVVGLLRDTPATVITARGGLASPSSADQFHGPYLRAILAFIGIERVDLIALEGTAQDPASLAPRLARARAEVDELFAEPAWLGPFSAEDRREITDLRAAQAAAIERGDAVAYAGLCTDDVQLLIPGHERVSGREALLECEARLFASASFAAFRKTPERIERSGDLAVELGRQEVTMRGGAGPGVFAARQKYAHTLRRTPQGWRFAVLMSNDRG